MKDSSNQECEDRNKKVETRHKKKRNNKIGREREGEGGGGRETE